MIGMERNTMNTQAKACRLRATDILLVHTKRSFWGWLIRFGTHCYWNHALIVCSTGSKKQDYENMLAVDAKTDGTIVMSRVSDYFNRQDKYDVAVKRLGAGWFHNNRQVPARELHRHIRNIAVNEVQFRLGLRLMRSLKQIIRQLTVILRFIRKKIRHRQTTPNLPWNIRPAQVRAFTCGGFVQWCYYKAVSKMLEERGGDRSMLNDVIFNPRIKKAPTPFELLTTTPADLANCDKLSWKYVIRDGVVREISSSPDERLAVLPL